MRYSEEDREFVKEVMVKCECFAHAIELTKFEDDDDLFVSIWYLGRIGKKSLIDRIKDAWNILIGNRTFIEEVILNKESVAVLKNYLDEYLKSVNKKEERKS